MMRTGRSLDDYGLETYRRDNWTCRYCGFKGHDAISFRLLSIDHIVRRADGGRDEPENLVTACRACNDYFNRRTFASLEEKRQAIQQRLVDDGRFFEQIVAPELRPR